MIVACLHTGMLAHQCLDKMATMSWSSSYVFVHVCDWDTSSSYPLRAPRYVENFDL